MPSRVRDRGRSRGATAACSGELGIPVAAKGEKGCAGSWPEKGTGARGRGGLCGSEQMELKPLPLSHGVRGPQAGQDVDAQEEQKPTPKPTRAAGLQYSIWPQDGDRSLSVCGHRN